MVKKAEQEKAPWLGVEVADIRMIMGDGNLKAFADLKLEIAGDADHEGFMVVKGFCVMQGKSGVFVAPPRKASKDGRWFDVVESDDRVKKVMEEKILEAYNKEAKG